MRRFDNPVSGYTFSLMIKTLPLKGKRIVITRHSEGSGKFARRLAELGAETLELPLIEIQPAVDRLAAGDIFASLGSYEWLIFTSANGVKHFFNAFFAAYEDIRSLGFMRIAVVGKATAQAVREYHLKVDLQPKQAVAEALLAELKAEQTLDNLRMLVITGNQNRDVLVRGLEAERAIVDTLQVYETRPTQLGKLPAAKEFRQSGGDVLVFASSSAVKSFGEQADFLKLEPSAKIPLLCSLGPITTATMKQAGIPVGLETSEPSIDSLVDALITHFE